MPREIAYLHDVAKAISRINSYLAGVSQAEFESNTLLQDAVIRNLEIIGEAVKLLPPEIKSKRPEIPWQPIAPMRDKLIHHYFSVDLSIVWHTATVNLRDLEKCVAELLAEIVPQPEN